MEQDHLVCRRSVSEDINRPRVTENIIIEVPQKKRENIFSGTSLITVSLKIYFQ